MAKAQMMVAEITHQTVTMLMFVVLVLVIFVVLPNYESEYVPTMVKLSSAALLALALFTSYRGLDIAVGMKGEDSEGIGEQIFYNYSLNVALFVLIVFLVYTCL